MPFYFQGYRILSILLPGIWDTWFNIFVTSRDIEYLGKLITGIFANLKGFLPVLQGIWDIWYPPIQTSLLNRIIIFSVFFFKNMQIKDD